MSLGIDYAIRPFAGTGESTATNGLGFVQLMIGVVIALIGGAVLRGILSHDDGMIFASILRECVMGHGDDYAFPGG